MKRKIAWLVVSCLMTLSLVLASCAPAVTEEGEVVTEKEKEMETLTLTRQDGTKMTKRVEKPQYGGWVNLVTHRETIFKPFKLYSVATLYEVYESLANENWLMGPTGTGEFPMTAIYILEPFSTGKLAESWEHTDPLTTIVHLRKGIHWQNKPPVNGREFDADDVVFSWDQMQNLPGAGYYKPPETPPEKRYKVTALDKYTVEMKLFEPDLYKFRRMLGDPKIVPRELKDVDTSDWRNQVGTGPFMITDWVAGSSTTLTKNPDYWMDDPLRPGNREPYVDGATVLLITDASTSLAALRTGKIDRKYDVQRLDGLALMKTNPELKYVNSLQTDPPSLWPRFGVEPWGTKKEVRQAMMMAINFQKIVDDYYEGDAEILYHPFRPVHVGTFVPLEELPANLQELYSYNPEKAKQMLADAGYPNGFEMEVLTQIAWSEHASLFKEYLAEIGITLNLKVLDSAVLDSVSAAHNFEGAVFGTQMNNSQYWEFTSVLRKDWSSNKGNVDDPWYWSEVTKLPLIMDIDARNAGARELARHVIEQSYYIPFPATYNYIFWQPWLKNYGGEISYGSGGGNQLGIVQHVWIDQELKKEMGH